MRHSISPIMESALRDVARTVFTSLTRPEPGRSNDPAVARIRDLDSDEYRSFDLSDPGVAYELAANPSCPPDVLLAVFTQAERLRRGDDGLKGRMILFTLCYNPAIPDEVVHELLHHAEQGPAARVFGNPHRVILALISDGVLPRLGVESRAWAAANPACPQHMLVRLLDDPAVDVRLTVAHRENLDRAIVHRLLVDRSRLVRSRAGHIVERMPWPEQRLALLQISRERLYDAVARMDADGKARCLSDPHPRFRLALAKCTQDVEQLAALSSDSDIYVRRATGRRMLEFL